MIPNPTSVRMFNFVSLLYSMKITQFIQANGRENNIIALKNTILSIFFIL